MKTFTANFTTEKNKKVGSKPATLLQIEASSTLYYSDQSLTVGVQAYTAKVTSWGRIRSQVISGEEVIRTGEVTLELINNPRIDSLIQPGQIVNILSWFRNLTTSDTVTIFKGIITDNISWDAYKIRFSVQDIGAFFNNRIGTPLDTTTYPNADPDDVGKILPVVYGDLKDHPCLAIVAGAVSTLLDDISAGASSIELSDASAFPGSGTIIIGDEEDITYSGKSSNTLTGVANVSFDYPRATKVLEKVASLKYLAANHIVKDITNPRIVPFGQKIEDSVRIDSADFSIDNNDNNTATITITNIASVKKKVEISVTQQPNSSITQPVHSDSGHGHTTGAQVSMLRRATSYSAGVSWNNPANGIDSNDDTYTDATTTGSQLSYQANFSTTDLGTIIEARIVIRSQRTAGTASIQVQVKWNGSSYDQTISLGNNLATRKFVTSITTWSQLARAQFDINAGAATTARLHEIYFEVDYTPDINNGTASITRDTNVNFVDVTIGGNSVADTLGGTLIANVKGNFDYIIDTLWTGGESDKLYLQSGRFTSTLKDSEDVSSINAAASGVSWDGANVLWVGLNTNQKLYLQSGKFTSTVKDSEDISAIDNVPRSISWDGTNTPWCGNEGNSKLYLQSGKFTSTLKTSQDIDTIDNAVNGISWDGTNTPVAGNEADKLYLFSGQFTSTLKDSEDVSAVDTGISGISWDGTNTPWCGFSDDKLYLTSGQFTSTLKDSEDISAIDNTVTGISGKELHYTGTPGTLIEEPSAVIHHLQEKYGNSVTHNDLDIDGSFADLAANGLSSAAFAFAIRKAVETNLISSQLAMLAFARWAWIAGTGRTNRIKLPGTSVKSLDKEDIYLSRSNRRLQASGSIRSLDLIQNDIEVKYNLNSTLGPDNDPDAYNGTTSDTDSASITNFGTRKRSYLAFPIADNSTMADDLLDKLLKYKAPAKKELNITTNLTNLELEPGDYVNVLLSEVGVTATELHEVLEVEYIPPVPTQKNRPEIILTLRSAGVVEESLSITGTGTPSVEDLSVRIESLLIATGTGSLSESNEVLTGGNPIWANSDDFLIASKLYLTQGQFTSTILDSEDISGVNAYVTGISSDGTNTFWCGTDTTQKLYLQSGIFTSTLKTSQDVSGVDTNPQGISSDGTNTPWIGQEANKLYLTSGEFTSTLKDSEDVSAIETISTGISFDGTNTPWCGQSGLGKMYLQSGQFTSTIKTSLAPVDNEIQGISWTGTNTPWCEYKGKMYLQSGQFTSTIKTSQNVSGFMSGSNLIDICLDRTTGRL